MTEKAILVILDGLGLRNDTHANAARLAETPTLDRFNLHLSRTRLRTCGPDVGLPEGVMGNSEVGHMNLGAGRVVPQVLLRIDRAIREGTLGGNEAIAGALEYAREGTGRLHLLGLVSDGGVHSQAEHLHALLEEAETAGVPEVRVHAFTDGRDTGPESGAGFLRELQEQLDAHGNAGIATVTGRYWAMDRDERWDRTRRAYDAIVHGDADRSAPTAVEAATASYAEGTTDEFVEPTLVEGVDGRVRDGDAVFTFNFRPDRMRQLVCALGEDGFGGFPVPDRPDVHVATMTRYRRDLPFPVAFPKLDLEDTLGEVVSRAGRTQLRIAETEKYAHVTYFLNGGREVELAGEERVIVDSPKVATYDEQPEMSAPEVTDRVVEALEAERFDLVVLNYANPDMVGHTGDLDAAIAAVEAVDACVKRVLEAAGDHYHVFLTADHGNCDQMVADDGSPHTAHTLNDVPFIHVGPGPQRRLRPGRLGDVAPTLLEVMGLDQPEAMTGESLFEA